MSAQKKRIGLGRGLDALFTDEGSSSNEILMIPLGKLLPNPEQPRKHFSEEKIISLADTIKKEGVISPLIVIKKDNTYLIVAGERRYRASKIAGLDELPCIVRDLHSDDILTISLIENIQREDLNPIEEAMGVKDILSKTGFTHEKVAKILGKSRVYVTNLLRLLTLPAVIIDLIANNKLSEGHGRTLVGMSDETALRFAKKVIENDLSVRKLEDIVGLRKERSKKGPKAVKAKKDLFISHIEKDLANNLSRDVKLRSNKDYRGEIRISFYDLDDLNGLLALLKQLGSDS
ncbi:ParB/RepB/Spo0J family partition protein [bacterium]|nr:ParB/RepB/Spo0J family partition protein [bacterium]